MSDAAKAQSGAPGGRRGGRGDRSEKIHVAVQSVPEGKDFTVRQVRAPNAFPAAASVLRCA